MDFLLAYTPFTGICSSETREFQGFGGAAVPPSELCFVDEKHNVNWETPLIGAYIKADIVGVLISHFNEKYNFNSTI